MGFRENLKLELEDQDKKVKELASETGISRRTIDQYLATVAKMPSAENAVKIAKALNVSVEYLVTGNQYAIKEKETNKIKLIDENTIELLRKYHTLIEKCEHLSKENIKLLEQLADGLIK